MGTTVGTPYQPRFIAVAAGGMPEGIAELGVMMHIHSVTYPPGPPSPL